MAHKLQICIWLFVWGCFTKHPSLEELSIPSDPEIGSIAAREKVIRALIAVENNEQEIAQQLFFEAHKLDPHPTIERLAKEALEKRDSP